MAFRMTPLSELVRLVDDRNKDLLVTNLLGLNIKKEFMPSIANQTELDLSKYKIIRKGQFVLNVMQVGRDEVLRVSLYIQEAPAIVSPAYLTFEMIPDSGVEPEYLMLLLQRPEFDRFAWFISDSSVRGALEWPRFLEVEIPVLISPKAQNHVVAVSQNLEILRSSLESSLADLEKALESCLSQQLSISPLVPLRDLVELSEDRNQGLGKESVRGISINKEFIKSKANLTEVDVSDYKVVRSGEIAYVTVTSRNGEKISIALNLGSDVLVSKTYLVFRPKKGVELLPEYAFMWFRRPEFDRFSRFHSWGSARETFDWNDFLEVSIPIPNLEVQEAIVKILRVLEVRRVAQRVITSEQRRISRVLYMGIMQNALKDVA
jgi:type I restriction enzyme S subunit